MTQLQPNRFPSSLQQASQGLPGNNQFFIRSSIETDSREILSPQLSSGGLNLFSIERESPEFFSFERNSPELFSIERESPEFISFERNSPELVFSSELNSFELDSTDEIF